MQAIGYVYKTTNQLNQRLYIGKRRGEFVPTYLGSGWALKTAIKKYGAQAFNVEVLAYALTEYDLDWMETHCISEYRELNGRRVLYNIADGANGGNCTPEMAAKGQQKKRLHSTDEREEWVRRGIETKRKNGTLKPSPQQVRRAIETKRRRGSMRLAGLKAAQTRRERGVMIGPNHHYYGKKRELAAIEKMRAKLTGKKQSPDTIAKRVAKNTGQRRSPEQRQRQSNAAKKRWSDSELRANVLSSHKTDCPCGVCVAVRRKRANTNSSLGGSLTQ